MPCPNIQIHISPMGVWQWLACTSTPRMTCISLMSSVRRNTPHTHTRTRAQRTHTHHKGKGYWKHALLHTTHCTESWGENATTLLRGTGAATKSKKTGKNWQNTTCTTAAHTVRGLHPPTPTENGLWGDRTSDLIPIKLDRM